MGDKVLLGCTNGPCVEVVLWPPGVRCILLNFGAKLAYWRCSLFVAGLRSNQWEYDKKKDIVEQLMNGVII